MVACDNKPKKEVAQEIEDVSPPQEGVSFTGKPLYRQKVSEELLSKSDSLIELIDKKGDLSEEDYIQKGNHYASSRRYRDAIEVYTEGLSKYPESFKLRRYRAHRYLSVRETEKAITDLTEAVDLLDENTVKELENDSSGKPWGTYEHWIWYHIGLYHYLNANYEKAAEAYQKCIATAINGKNVVGPSDWLYNTYQKMGNPEKAAAVLEKITPDFNTDRDHIYFKRVMLFKGLSDPEAFMDLDKPTDQWTAGDITRAYALANWYQYNDQPEVAEEIYSMILEGPVWNVWAYVATESEVSRSGMN